MSQHAVERTLGKLVTDEAFRREFFRAPARTSLLAGLYLSDDELDALTRIPSPLLERLSKAVDARICRLCIPEAADAREITR
jgi:hypothetical protein